MRTIRYHVTPAAILPMCSFCRPPCDLESCLCQIQDSGVNEVRICAILICTIEVTESITADLFATFATFDYCTFHAHCTHSMHQSVLKHDGHVAHPAPFGTGALLRHVFVRLSYALQLPQHFCGQVISSPPLMRVHHRTKMHLSYRAAD